MSTAVVTGGAGFLGSHLCDHLVAKGFRVICVDNLETGSLQNVEHLRGDSFGFVHHDMTAHLEIDEAVDLVFHLASPASPIDYLRAAAPDAEGRRARHAQRARPGEVRSARASCSRRRARCTATRSIHPQPETYWGNVNPIGPRGVYDEAKRYAEALTMAYHRQQGVDTCIVRIFNTYGPRMRPNDGRAIPTFIRQALAERAADGLRRRLADAQLLLRRRSRSRSRAARRERRAPARQHRQPARADAARARGDRHPRHRLEERDRLRGAARRRSPGAAARHHARPAAARLGAADRSRGRPAERSCNRPNGSH